MPIIQEAQGTPEPNPLALRVEVLGRLLGLVAPCPPEWLRHRATTRKLSGSGQMECLRCRTWRELVTSWRKAMKWTEGMDRALSVMLASVTSTRSVGDQLWVKILGPASCGKSTLCEALSVNTKYVLAKSTIRGFHSGYQTDKEANEDHSLVAQVSGKTLVTKDGDTLLQSPNLGQILSEARDLYDSTARTSYRNASSRDYSGIRMTWLLCGTSSLRQIDSSELGERFLDCVMMDSIDDELEDEILLRVAHRVDRNMATEADGKPETNYEAELAEAMMLTGGYVEYLRTHATELLSSVHMPTEALVKCTRLGKFVAFARARPSKVQDEDSDREFAARLVSQHVRLAKCLAVVLNRRTVDEEVMRRVKRVAMDTGRGHVLGIVELLAQSDDGCELKALSIGTNQTEDVTRKMLRFMRKIGAATLNEVHVEGMRTKRNVWRLSLQMARLYEAVTEEDESS